jgi:hypothetical protein
MYLLEKIKSGQHFFGSEDGAALLFLLRPANHRPCKLSALPDPSVTRSVNRRCCFGAVWHFFAKPPQTALPGKHDVAMVGITWVAIRES